MSQHQSRHSLASRSQSSPLRSYFRSLGCRAEKSVRKSKIEVRKQNKHITKKRVVRGRNRFIKPRKENRGSKRRCHKIASKTEDKIEQKYHRNSYSNCHLLYFGHHDDANHHGSWSLSQ